MPQALFKSAAQGSRAWLSLAIREPLVHFFLAATLLLLGFHFCGRPEIRVSAPLLNGLCKDYENRMGRAATPEEVELILKQYLEDEILFREALRNGLVRDNRVRDLLIYTMRTSLRPIVPPPSDEELEALRMEAPDTYRFPGKVSFEHVSFAERKQVPPGLLGKLRAGANPQEFGERISLANPMPLTYLPHLEHLLGTKCVAALRNFEDGKWYGPISSERGVHFIRVLERLPAQDMPMSEIRPTLVGRWNVRRENEEISRRVQEVLKSYRVTIPSLSKEQP